MGRIKVFSSSDRRSNAREYQFTAVFIPVYEHARRAGGKSKSLRLPNPMKASGFQVTVLLLPGLITYGRTMAEARQMARDAIQCHIEGMKKAGEPIPDESSAQTEKVRVPA